MNPKPEIKSPPATTAGGGGRSESSTNDFRAQSITESHASASEKFDEAQAHTPATPPPIEADEPLPILPLVPESPADGKPLEKPTVLTPAVLVWDALATLEIPPRPALLGDWFAAADYGIIMGKRGLGKSWLALGIAHALANGRDFGPWKCPASCRVLYVDGEMPLGHFRDRLESFGGGGRNFFTLSHQTVFDKSNAALCASDIGQQQEITRICEENKINVLFLDNGACLFRNVKENDADEFRDFIEGWLLDLRRRGISVVLVQHAGRNGEARGTSKREDAAFWMLRLDDIPGGKEVRRGACFLTRFTKNRNAITDPPSYEWHFEPDANGKTSITFKDADSTAVLLQWIRDGLTNCSEIAREMGVSNGTVSKLAARANEAGLLRKNGRDYELV
jgi:hypothetical protein